jgi:membrane-associated phospholipid phosphatase
LNQSENPIRQSAAQDATPQASENGLPLAGTSNAGVPGKSDPLVPVAWVLSLLMHPLPLPSLMFALVLLFAPELMLAGNMEIRWRLMALLFLATFALPALSVLTLRLFGNLPSLTMTRREDRRIPFLFVSAIYMTVTIFFYRIFPQIPFVVLGLMSITACLLVLTAISLFWKISAHGIAAGGVTGFMAGLVVHYHNQDLVYPLSILLVLSGAVMWARLYLNHHTPSEVWTGWFAGFSICISMVLLLYPVL